MSARGTRRTCSPPRGGAAPFAGVVRFARHPSIATFARDCVCYLHERRNEPDLQDIAVSAMALAALALDDRVFVEHLRDVGGGESTGGRAGFPDPWAAALLRGDDASRMNDASSEHPRSPFILALETLAVGAGGDWAEDESHFVVIVAECARELLARLADAGLYAPNGSNGGSRLGTGSEAEADPRNPNERLGKGLAGRGRDGRRAKGQGAGASEGGDGADGGEAGGVCPRRDGRRRRGERLGRGRERRRFEPRRRR